MQNIDKVQYKCALYGIPYRLQQKLKYLNTLLYNEKKISTECKINYVARSIIN